MNLKGIIKKFGKKMVWLIKSKELVPIPTMYDSQTLLQGKVALVSGGSSGIGYAIAKAFLNSGCKVIITGTNEERLKKCCKNLRGEGDIVYQVLNVLDIENIFANIEKAASCFGENRIDILVNSHGVIGSSSFFDVSEEEYDKIMGINAKGTFFMCKAMSKYMIGKGVKGHILNITSSSALRPAWKPYQMSKWTVKGFTLGLADLLLPYGIIVNAIAPGPVATPMLGKEELDSLYMDKQPSGRYAMPEEIANLAVFMVSDMGNLIVGDTVYMTGGSGTLTLHH